MQGNSFIIRRAMPTDIAAMASIWLDTVEMLAVDEPRYTLAPDGERQWAAAMQGWLTCENRAVFVAERPIQQQIIGYCSAALVDNQVGLLPTRIGQLELAITMHGSGQGGIGTQLLEAVTVWLQANGVGIAEVRILARHAIAQAFWRAKGALPVADVMWLRLHKT